MTASTRLTDLLTPVVSQAGYDLEDLSVTAAGARSVVRVLVDRDGGITLDDVAAVSRAISEALDAADEQEPSLLGPSYVLEVSSPGVDRPLTAPRHWQRNAGRLVTVHPVEGATYDGRITSADDATVVLDVEGDERVVPYASLAKGVVQVEFNRPGAAALEDVDDEDDEDES